ncbi:MAG: type II toxin-antitoxin system HicB family antitoxin [Verrucomicrobia bacterium]|nr:type II toxin-antitoxin system HicB family antitoxin [Verrucomicrobiota bacterium]
MRTLRYIGWKDGDLHLGYHEDLPDYMPQGGSLEELEENLRDILSDVEAGRIPQARTVRQLTVA